MENYTHIEFLLQIMRSVPGALVQLEHWNNGISTLEYWSVGIMESWVSELECWNIGIMERSKRQHGILESWSEEGPE
jgi:hypothetical protein